MTMKLEFDYCMDEIVDLCFNLKRALYGAHTIDEFKEATKHIFETEHLDGDVARLDKKIYGAFLHHPLGEEGVEKYNPLLENKGVILKATDIEVLTLFLKDNDTQVASRLIGYLTNYSNEKIIFPHHKNDNLSEHVCNDYRFAEIGEMERFYPNGESALVKIYPRQAVINRENNLNNNHF